MNDTMNWRMDIGSLLQMNVLEIIHQMEQLFIIQSLDSIQLEDVDQNERWSLTHWNGKNCLSILDYKLC